MRAEETAKRSLKGICLLFAGLLLLSWLCHSAEAGEWMGLKMGVSTTNDAKKALGLNNLIGEYPGDFLLLFDGANIHSRIRASTVRVNLRPDRVIEGILIHPEWGVVDKDVHKVYGKGNQSSYADFLASRGKSSFGAGTHVFEKLHYIPLDNLCENYPDKQVLVIYDNRDLASGAEVVKLIVYY